MKNYYWSFVFLLLVLTSCAPIRQSGRRLDISRFNANTPEVHNPSPNMFVCGNNSLLRNNRGLWELYVSGDPLQRGLKTGALCDSLLKKQERVFFSKLSDWIPSKSRQIAIKKFIRFYNRKLTHYVPNEYKAEIYGLSKYASHSYDFIAPPYLRTLYLHGAHDIGHALQDLAIVGCSSFAAWGKFTVDSSLILGRNFDFYVNDSFAQDKIVAFVRPDSGHDFMMVTWPGMIGAVSGMNNEGLTVTINAAKSKIPLQARTPISILTREILQYASNIDEAVAIAQKRKVFVSESIMVGSANNRKAVIIEVSPGKIDVYEEKSGTKLLSTNHFQGNPLGKSKRNLYQIANSHSQYRYDRLVELMNKKDTISVSDAAEILRDKEGLNGKYIGYGNEKSINQLIAHHSIIFKPEQRLVWVSANPYQLGSYVCFDLNKVFKKDTLNESLQSFSEQKLELPADSFMFSINYANYEKFRVMDHKMDQFLNEHKGCSQSFIKEYENLNPKFWLVYYKAGLYYYSIHDYISAHEQFKAALTMEVTTLPEIKKIEKYLLKTNRRTNKK